MKKDGERERKRGREGERRKKETEGETGGKEVGGKIERERDREREREREKERDRERERQRERERERERENTIYMFFFILAINGRGRVWNIGSGSMALFASNQNLFFIPLQKISSLICKGSCSYFISLSFRQVIFYPSYHYTHLKNFQKY
jgi:hypothetical protein